MKPEIIEIMQFEWYSNPAESFDLDGHHKEIAKKISKTSSDNRDRRRWGGDN